MIMADTQTTQFPATEDKKTIEELVTSFLALKTPAEKCAFFAKNKELAKIFRSELFTSETTK
jgi:hypothetical protein